jgi:hypothetical protein
MKATSLSMFSKSTHSYLITHIFIYGYIVALQLPYFSDPLHSTEISSMKIVSTKKSWSCEWKMAYVEALFCKPVSFSY